MAKKIASQRHSVGGFAWNAREKARIKRNLAALDGKGWEAQRSSNDRSGRSATRGMKAKLEDQHDPLQDVTGIAGDLESPFDIDEELYGDKSV